MSKSEFSDLLEIVGDLKDEIYLLRQQREIDREQIALLSEAVNTYAQPAITSKATGPFEPGSEVA